MFWILDSLPSFCVVQPAISKSNAKISSDRSPALDSKGTGRKSGQSIVKDLSTRPNKDCIATDQRVKSVGLFLASFAGIKGISGTPGTVAQKGKPLEKQKIAVS